MSSNISLEATRLLLYASLVAVTAVHTTPSCGQDAGIRKQLEGVDLEGVQQLRLSPNGELAAGLTKLYDNPGYGTGSFSLVRIWSVKKKQLLHQFRIPGEVYEAVFSPDGSILVAADKTGNLGYTTTLRVCRLVDGSSEKRGFFHGVSNQFCFSPDGKRLAAIQFPEYSLLNPLGDFTFKLYVWHLIENDGLSISIPNALGDNRGTFPFHEWDGNPDSNERVRKSLARVTPVLRGFSPDGKQLICDFESGPRIFDARSGRFLRGPEVASVSLFKSMLMIALQQVPANVNSLSIEIVPRKNILRLERAADGWWRESKDENSAFQVNGKLFVSHADDVETNEDILMLLGLKEDTNLSVLSSLKHPLGVIKIDRDEMGLKFWLEEVSDETDSGEILQAGEVLWTNH